MPKVLLLILDGWGLRKEKQGNAIALAGTLIFNSLQKRWPSTILKASGTAVGLPSGVMGNSEVGHLTLGAGRIMESDLVRINAAIKDSSFFRNRVLVETMHHAKKYNEKLHL